MRRFATTPHLKILAAAMGMPAEFLALAVKAPDLFHVFASYDGRRYGVCHTPGRLNSTHKDRNYTQDEARALADWLNDRAAGYPPVKSLVDNPQF